MRVFVAGFEKPEVSGFGRSFPDRPKRPRLARTLTAVLLAFLTGVSSGCYTFSPLGELPPPGTEVSLGLNDQGRVALGQSVGPSARTIDGKLAERTDSAFVVNVNSVSYFNGLSNKWSGEPVTVGRSFVQEARQKKFSASRTVLVGGLVGAAVLGLVFGADLFASAPPDRTPDPGPPEPDFTGRSVGFSIGVRR
jgi:hypothetical protein